MDGGDFIHVAKNKNSTACTTTVGVLTLIILWSSTIRTEDNAVRDTETLKPGHITTIIISCSCQIISLNSKHFGHWVMSVHPIKLQ